jgi:pimeloyl-ACP methyl ester carboxylesterase
MQQEIRYCTTPDGVRIAYAIVGKGPPLVRAAHWFTHLDHDLKNPVTRHIVLGMAHRHRLLRYDSRGMGLSQRDVADISMEAWIRDLETVVDHADFDRFALVGISQGAGISINYAVRHPERVSHLILLGGFARGLLHRGASAKQREMLELGCQMIRQGWGSEVEAHRQWFTSQFMPGATAEQQHAFNEMQRASTTPENAERALRAMSEVSVAGLLPQVKAPTLVINQRDDIRAPFELGQELAAGIPAAKFVPLEGRNHIFLPGEPVHRQIFDAVADFLGEKRIRGTLPGTAGLTERLETRAKALEQNWFIKIVIVLAAVTGCFIFLLEMWKLWRPH